MTILSRPLRRQLETAIRQAREIAETAAKEAIARIGVTDAEAPSHLSEVNKALRRRLRAHARTLGDSRNSIGTMTTARLQDEAAYEIWHRMLFGRFLAERGLLIHPDLGAAISVSELRELAQEEGASDEWALAEQYAAPGLPGVFKPDDPVLSLRVAPEFSQRLRAVLSGLPEDVFDADDSLGWTYQFWRASEKDAVNQAGGKIGATELPAVTQLFTESYMVRFLLHNTLGAWWAGKVLASDPGLARCAANEDTLREACALRGVAWEFLRFVRDDDGKGPWRPAAGTFSGWPIRAAEITFCDPCCGSGHFLVEAFFIIAALRQKEEGLSANEAAVSVLRDNLHGLEIDGRCVQIAAFNVALAAWKLAGASIPLPSPHIAWVGAPPPMGRIDMASLADGDTTLRRALEMLHDQFAQAPLLGSLLEIGARDLLDSDLRERGEVALALLRGSEPEQAEGAVAARGLFDATALLAQRYVLLATNVPYLQRGKHDAALGLFLERHYTEGRADLATAMLQRMLALTSKVGAIAAVSPQNWLFQDAYEDFRSNLLLTQSLCLIAGLGSSAFEEIGGHVVNVCLSITKRRSIELGEGFYAVDLNEERSPHSKAVSLPLAALMSIKLEVPQRTGNVISLSPPITGSRLSEFVDYRNGLQTGDYARFGQKFWEHEILREQWSYFQTTVRETVEFGGMEGIVKWENGLGDLASQPGAVIRGTQAWGRQGVAVSAMGQLVCARYQGALYDDNTVTLIPREVKHLPAIWSFCSSKQYAPLVRQVDKALKVRAGLVRVPFDLNHWMTIAASAFPNGLAEPYSDNPTQWLFHGHPAFAEEGTELHVALARVAGYRWPSETDPKMGLSDLAKKRIALSADLPAGDADGLLPLHIDGSVPSLADRLRTLLASAYGEPLPLPREQALIRSADTKIDKKEWRNTTLESWLADRAFRQHCILFHQRPFLWHVWDGMKDGFSAFLNYHRLDRGALDRLTYTLLGDWIRIAKANGQTAQLGRAERLQQTLDKIIEGEKPFDIFVRWKSLAQQPIGWEPDLDDGVRLNIRPLITAGILREQPRGVSWNKDRGTDVPSAPWFNLGPSYGGKNGDRINDHHTTLAEKRAARGTS